MVRNKGFTKVNLGVHNQDSNVNKLNPSQKEILLFLTEEFLTPKQIAIRRGTSVRAVYKTIAKLKKKGVLSGSSYKGFKISDALPNAPKKRFTNTTSKAQHYIRLHGQEFNIKILFKSEQYHMLKQKANRITLDNNTIRLYKDSIEVYSGKDFEHEDINRVEAMAIEYWNKFFFRLEDYLKVIILKDGHFNIKEVKQHYAEVDNELAKEQRIKKEKIKIFGTKDGRLWLHTDYSFSEDEIETLHPLSAKEDMQETVRPFFNDLRDKHHDLPSQTKSSINAILNVIKEVAESQLQTNETVRSQTKLLESLLPKPIKEKPMSKERPIYVG